MRQLSLKPLFILLLALFCYSIHAASFGPKGGWKLSDLPNPMIDPAKCGRGAVPRSSVCDCDHILTKSQQDEIEGHINFIKEGEVAVSVIHQMDLVGTGYSIEKGSEVFARGLHDRWGVGSAEKNNGILVFLSIADRAVYISTGDGMKEKFPLPIIEGIIQRMKPFLRNADYGGALVNCIIEIELGLAGKALPAGRRESTSSSEKEEPKIGALILIFTGVAGMLGYTWWQKRKLERMDQGRRALDSLIREVGTGGGSLHSTADETGAPSGGAAAEGTAEQDDQGKVFYTTSCPICLENFEQLDFNALNNGETAEIGAPADEGVVIDDGTVNATTSSGKSKSKDSNKSSKTNSGLKRMALRCGHTFCNPCLETYLRSNAGRKCPICRLPVHADYDHMEPPPRPPRSQPQQHPRAPGSSGAGAGAGSSSYDDGTSCARNRTPASETGAGAGAGTASPGLDTENAYRNNQDPGRTLPTHDYYSYRNRGFYPRFGYSRSELLFRMNRMHYLYPDVMTAQLLHDTNVAIDNGTPQDAIAGLTQRSVEIQRTVTQMREQAAAAAKRSGSGGASRSSFGGGRSSGGGGGRW
jgi:uncharacterized membrane protein YgcG